ncbi:hypothetical protein AAF712_002240 [Marasmius tenuissimus]|uniref:F-box domain-containing protein n=1 Tax=Marasmius tenuissimus TaxID=585030 RepID=A0ABR3AAL7_9AGAR
MFQAYTVSTPSYEFQPSYPAVDVDMDDLSSQSIDSGLSSTRPQSDRDQSDDEATAVVPSSPFLHLLSSNQFISSTERAQIRDTLDDVEGSISRVEDAIRSLETNLNQLRRKQHKLNTYAQEHKALLSPARRLVPEIWSEIFLWCLPQHTLEHHMSRRSVSGAPVTDTSFDDAPLLMTRVCSSWRQIALSTPRLWSNITYTVCRPSAFKHQLQKLETWLSRSGATPLSVVICRSFFDANNRLNHPYLTLPDSIPSLAQDPVLQYILAQSHRWESAEIVLPANESAVVLAPLKGNLANLKRLTFGMFWNDTTTAQRDSQVDVDVFESASQLREVSLVEETRLNVALPAFDGSRLTSLHVGALMSSHDALSMLYRYPNVKSWDLNVMVTLSPPKADIIQSERPALQLESLTLSISGNTVCTYGSFLNYLNVPHLSELRIRTHKWVQGQMVPFLKQLPPMRSVEFSSPSLSPEDFVECLSLPNFQSLERLQVGEGMTWHVPFAPSHQAVAQLFSSGKFLPRLDSVRWVAFGRGSESYCSKMVAQMLKTRMDDSVGAGRGLRSFDLSLNKKWGETTARSSTFDYADVRARGLQVDVRVRWHSAY